MGYQVPSVNQCYDFSCVIGQLQAWCCSHAPLVQSVYDECKGTSLSEQVTYLFGVVRDCVAAQQCLDGNFETLYNFVKDFFSTLDLQKEVNNWLDAAEEDGTLEKIFGNLYQNLKLEIQSIASGSPKGVYSSLSDLKKAIPAGNNNIYVTTGDGNWNYWNGSDWVAGGKYISNIIKSMGTLVSPCLVDLHGNTIKFFSLKNVIIATDGVDYVSLDTAEYTLELTTEEQYQTLFVGINKTEKTFVATNITKYLATNDNVIYFAIVNIQYDYYYINGYGSEYKFYMSKNSKVNIYQNISKDNALYLYDYNDAQINVVTPEKVFYIDFSQLNTDLPDHVFNNGFKIQDFILCYNLITSKFFVVDHVSSIRSTDIIIAGCWYGSLITGVLTNIMVEKNTLLNMIEIANLFSLGYSVDWKNTKNITVYGGYDTGHPLNVLVHNGKRITITSTVDGYIIEYPTGSQSVSFYICYDTSDKKLKLLSGSEVNAVVSKIYIVGYINYASNIVNIFGSNQNKKEISGDFYTSAYNALSFVREENQKNKVIAFLTDLHYSVSPDVINDTLTLISKMADSGLINCVVLGGDYTDGNFSTPDECLTKMKTIKNMLPTNIPCFMLRGNHDDNSYSTNSSERVPLSSIVTTQKWIENLIPTPYNHPDGKLYGYYDIDNYRIVILDYEDYNVEESGGFLVYNGRNWMGFSDNMLEYLATNVFTDSTKKYLVFCHGPYKPELSAYNYRPVNYDKLIALLKAVQSGGTWNEHNFTGYNKNIVFYYSGHNHSDLYSLQSDIDTLFVSVGCGYLLTKKLEDETLLSAGYDRYTLRSKNTSSEMLFDLINFSGERGRVGVGINSK